MQAGTDWEDDLAYALELANELPLGLERDNALKQAYRLKQAACMVRWINTTQLRPPRKYQQ
jgi:hypothetical protein